MPPFPTQARVAALRHRHGRTLRQAQLASGAKKGSKTGVVDATLARFWSPYHYVPDYEFIENDSAQIIKRAQRQLMWAHRLAHSEPPFTETLLLFERGLKAQPREAVEKAIRDERWRQSVERRDARRAKRKGMAYTRPTVVVKASTPVPPPPSPPPLKPKRGRPTKAEEIAKVKRLKKRTREERIADLQRALEGK